MGREPDTFIVGAPKAGTTSLYVYLNQHPQVFMSGHKEPHYFAKDMQVGYRVESLTDYLALFARATNEVRIGEASVSYLQSEAATEAIRRFSSDPRIVIMLRNPVDLVVSLHAQLLGSAAEDQVDLGVALSLQEERRQGRRVPLTCKYASYLQYERTATFSDDVARYLRVFGSERVKIVIFDDFVRDTTAEGASICSFLGVDPQLGGKLRQHNSRDARVVPNLRLVRLMHRAPFIRRAIRRVAPAQAIGWLKRGIALRTQRQPRPTPSVEVVERLKRTFDADVRQLSEILQRDLHRTWFENVV